MDDEAVAYACGVCEDVRAAHWRPDFCGRCRARFDLGAPCAIVRLRFEIAASDGAIACTPSYAVEAIGPWRDDALERVREAFGHG